MWDAHLIRTFQIHILLLSMKNIHAVCVAVIPEASMEQRRSLVFGEVQRKPLYESLHGWDGRSLTVPVLLSPPLYLKPHVIHYRGERRREREDEGESERKRRKEREREKEREERVKESENERGE